MARSNPKLKVTKPKNVFIKPLSADFKELFKALSKGIGHTVIGKWEEIGTDTGEALSAIGLSTEPEELAFLLIRRSIIKALFELVGDSASQQLADIQKNSNDVIEQLDLPSSLNEVHIDYKFLDRPSELPLIDDVQTLLHQWLERNGINEPTSKAISERFPSYFVYALNQEWRRNSKSYIPLIEALDTPFTKSGEREWAWVAYSALLQRRIREGIFDEPISLYQIYIPLNAFYIEDTEDKSCKDLDQEITGKNRQCKRVVVSLQDELGKWLQMPNSQDAIRVISGGPGSGKSSFARIFAAQLAQNGKLKVLYVPLHLIDPSRDLVDEVGRFVRDEGILLQNPLDPNSPEPNLLIIFDGLDELASQGKAAEETARAFVREVEKTVEKRNLQSVNLRVLISGRELIVQQNESEFRRPRQILTLLPYFVPHYMEGHDRRYYHEDGVYHDPDKLLKQDLRQQWWQKYGELTGKAYKGLPKELNREDLDEITAQPLLNYLVALSLARDKLDFKKGINLNSIYADLVAAVHERGYEKHRPHVAIRQMKLEEFSRVLEEIGLAAWHGDGRTTTIMEIEAHCRTSGIGKLIDAFKEGAEAGVTRLLAAFFFRQYGQRPSGDPTFVFTHKSFGEYLTSRRIVRAIERVIREMDRRDKNPDEGWDEKEALRYWAQICGPNAISQYLHTFLINEIKLRNAKEMAQWQTRLSELFSYMLRHGMPMEQLQIRSFREALFQSRNSEEALLVVLNSCARVTKQISTIKHPDPTTFAEWLKRIQGSSLKLNLAINCLSFLDLSDARFETLDLFTANLQSSNLRGVCADYAFLLLANLQNADLQQSSFNEANLTGANLTGANLKGADLKDANLREARLKEANLEEAKLRSAILKGANLKGANLKGARLEVADLKGANLEGANLAGANLAGANLAGANLAGANLAGANLKGANLKGANLKGANLDGAHLE